MTVLDTMQDLPITWIFLLNRVVVFDRIESSESKVWLVLLLDSSFNKPSRRINALLELKRMTGITNVFSSIASSHLFEFGFNGSKLVVIEVKPAVSLVACFISDLVLPLVLLVITSLIVVNHCSVSGSLNVKTLLLFSINTILCFRSSAL